MLVLPMLVLPMLESCVDGKLSVLASCLSTLPTTKLAWCTVVATLPTLESCRDSKLSALVSCLC